MTVAQLNGFFPPDFASDERQFIPFGRSPAGVQLLSERVEIEDARLLQAAAESEADFFARHGFVLLPHATQVRDWAVDAAAPDASEVARLYLPEIEAVIRERLFPGRRVEIRQMPNLLRRGRDMAVPFYATGVHSDFGLLADDYAVSVEAFASAETAQRWRQSFARDDVAGFLSIDFWRLTNMHEPLRHMPLALCDPASVDGGDLIATSMDIPASGRKAHHMSLRFNEGQRWFQYPHMTGDELLAFKLFECWKDAPEPRLGSVFHSAFEDPATPADAEPRQSCEHRVGVTVFRD